MTALARRFEQPWEEVQVPTEAEEAALERWAAEELSHALGHEWVELEGMAPFADVSDCAPDRGQPYEVVRSYVWADREGGDIVCEVTVYATPDRKGHFVRRRCVIRKG
jgi:hypothetical protein